MKSILFVMAFMATTATVFAQQVISKNLKPSITLLMPRGADDDMPGTRGASVVWHPLQKKYYAAMAGNMGYPLGVYDATGKRLSADSVDTREDIRGLWYNPQRKEIQGNTYSDYGWFGYKLNPKGIPVTTTTVMQGMNQPNEQSVGAYNYLSQEVLFLNEGYVEYYKMTDGSNDKEPLAIQWGRSKEEGMEEPDGTPTEYNGSVVYTGIKGAELGFYNIVELQIELYDINTGFLTRKLKLPEDAPTNSTFNFAFTNGMYWLFNMETRTWTAYK